MISELLPDSAASHETFEDYGEELLYEEELALLGKAVPKRRREFATVRVCARRALSGLGRPPAPLLPGTRNAPVWPAGVVGSMTHCDGYRAAAVARVSDLMALGIDAEPNLPLPEGVLGSIALPAEAAWAEDAEAEGA
ncbi:MAG: 4'-phosphopantetheinyl transferase family protein, partial [Streptomyces sp.]